MDYATKYGLATLLETYQMPQVILDYYPCGIFGKSRDGCPVLYEAYGRIDWKGLMYSVKRDDIVKSRLYNGLVVTEKCKELSLQLDKEVTQAILVYDLEGLSTKHMWKPGIDTFKMILSAFEEIFPHIFKHVIIIKAPKLFPIIYGLAKSVLSDETTRKVIVCGGNWMTDLQKYIDPSEIPEYYGGTVKDENDDPMCKSVICYGGDVPTTRYVDSQSMIQAEDFHQVTVSAGAVFSVEKEISTPGSIINWVYKTDDHDIAFSLDFKREKDQKSKENVTILLPWEKKACHFVPEDSMIVCDQIGFYCLNFDNSYSWTRSKKLYYKVTVE